MDSVEEAMAFVRDTLRQAPYANGQASVQDLLKYVERVRSAAIDGAPYPIRVKAFAYQPDLIRGLVSRRKDGATIWVSTALNACWTRFVTIKELMHLLLDDETTFITDPVDQLEVALQRIGQGKLGSEDYAFVSAMEYAFAAAQRPTPPIVSSLQVATKFKIPQRIVECYYDGDWADWSDTGRLLLEISQQLA
jgi:hypothetical protein